MSSIRFLTKIISNKDMTLNTGLNSVLLYYSLHMNDIENFLK